MKILQVGLGNNPGGLEAFVINYYKELAKRGVSFDFVSMYGRIAHEEEILRLSGRVFYVPNVKKDYFGYVKAMKALLRRERYDVVHVHMLSAANILPLKLARKAGVRTVIAHSHNTSAPGLLRKGMDVLHKPLIGRYATRRLACSEAAGAWLFGRRAMEEGQVILVPNAIDVEKYAFSPENRRRLREELGLSMEDLVIGHVGRFQIQKNHEGLLRIFAAAAKIEERARLLLVGEGELMEKIQAEVREYGLEDRVIFAGVRLDVERLLSAMDVFLFPSLFEGLPFTLVEAQANGLPCVISRTISREAVVSPQTVRMLDLREDEEIWARELLSFSGQEREAEGPIRDRLSRSRFDIQQEADRLLELYREKA
ncbi:MAG: glycosyltransferase family 1 protein [Eubacteriales bacterium]|nr:glycosyltransferase family 1 protein [Eubacteriales bacterium]